MKETVTAFCSSLLCNRFKFLRIWTSHPENMLGNILWCNCNGGLYLDTSENKPKYMSTIIG